LFITTGGAEDRVRRILNDKLELDRYIGCEPSAMSASTEA
jgi:hypothetical protein